LILYSAENCTKSGILKNYQTGFDYKFTNGWYAWSHSKGSIYEPNQTLST